MTRLVVPVLELYLASGVDPAPTAEPAGGGPVIIIVTTIAVVLGTIATAVGPALTEIAKNRGARRNATPASPDAPGEDPPVAAPAPAPDNPLTPTLQPGIDALAMVDAAVRDYRQQRDAALRRVDELLVRLDEANQTISRQLVYIARLEADLATRSQPDPYGRRPMYPDQDRYPPGGWQR